MPTRNIPLSSEQLDSAIEVLASAGQALQLTRFERLAYRALMISADVVMASYVAQLLATLPIMLDFVEPSGIALGIAYAVGFIYYASVLAGIISIALNFPLFRKAFRDRARLKERGLSSLSYFLWKESRRSQRISRTREALLIVIGLVNIAGLILLVIGYLLSRRETYDAFGEKETVADADPTLVLAGVLLVVIVVAFLSGTRYLRNQRERMELTASANELRKTLQSLRQRTDSGVVSVPAELLERTAKIESAQIAAQRKDAVLQGVVFRPNSYAITFDRDAAEQRADLGTADRVELEDLVAQLSTDGAQLELQPGIAKNEALRATTRSRRLDIAYSIDHASRGIRINHVRQEGQAHA